MSVMNVDLHDAPLTQSVKNLNTLLSLLQAQHNYKMLPHLTRMQICKNRHVLHAATNLECYQ